MSKDVKAISAVQPKEEKKAVGWVLDVWASAVHHQSGHLSGGESVSGSGDPEWRAIFSEPQPLPALGPTVPVCDRSDEVYDGTLGKYERHPRSDVRVLRCAYWVEAAKEGLPPVVTAYLLYKYPRQGNYAPSFRGYAWSDEPAKSFIERGVALGIEGFSGDGESLRRFAKWLRKRERDIKRGIRGMLLEKPDAATNPIPVASNF